MSASNEGTLVDSQNNPVLTDTAGQPPITEAKTANIIPTTPDITDPAYAAYLRSLDKNGNGKFDREEIPAFIAAIDATFRERSKSPRIQGFCALASGMSIGGKLSPEMLERVESGNKERAHKMVNDYLGTDIAKGIFKNGIAEVTDADLTPIVTYALDFAKACAAK